jgi:hypothetical protein
MTARIDDNPNGVQRLIDSCVEAHHGFRLAAEATEDPTLKRLFTIYAHQRSRFAEELKEYVSGIPMQEPPPVLTEWRLDNNADAELIQHCIDANKESLRVYQETLQHRISRKAHFLISAQFSLMQRVHERMHNLLAEETKPMNRVNVLTEGAVL